MYALQIENLHKTYANGVVALKDVSLTVKEGDFFALLGPNGAGKSTMIGIVSSLVNATSGDVKVFGTSIHDNRSMAMRMIGLVPQEINFNQFEKPIDIIVNQAGYYGIERAEAKERAHEQLQQARLFEKKDDLSRNLSGGMKRRLMIARAMVHNPKLLILDEPTAGVDIEIRRNMWEYIERINDEGTTVILTTHYLEEAEQLCRNIAIIDHGKIVENTTIKDLLSRLDVETFVLDLQDDFDGAEQLNGYDIRMRDSHTIEVDVPKSRPLNELFATLQQHNISVASMRNKSNRLEELFLRLVEDKG